MEVFFGNDFFYDQGSKFVRLEGEESSHCIRVLRHRCPDPVDIIDGEGTLYHCTLFDDNPRTAVAKVLEETPMWGMHPYSLTMAVCPTKNNERFEWFCEKATEMGVDTIVPVIGEHSERKVYKTDRAKRVVLSAAKQSLKGKLPCVEEPLSVSDWIRGSSCDSASLKLIAYCFEDGSSPRQSLSSALDSYLSRNPPSDGSLPSIIILIGPEGDFSPAEASLAMENGYLPVHLGDSRLRTETAALFAVAGVYYRFLMEGDRQQKQ